ncbi:homodimeric glycerol 3-phosphate dehydrogenase (quinone) [Oceanobacillus limi]|uniref:Aerobic glycerol-3-phosphate dehydrogenase n=1 Tax=Oceanobacillus limi TaxID=930131 RepID=A0A1I0BTR4_9BACI|nr:FAD-dependent oxidoreductase [Oceanobacillus limi]SET10427.1 homodimeric glycerol 3-phosphate dehydrogenase (quinone) [Oceanobacillus limi]
MNEFSSLKREQMISQLKEVTLDLLVIGGGITGAGISLDAVTRGLKTAVVEMQDFAAGTSSRSTKLVHGGLRYLKQLDVKVVAEVGKERAIVYENGPHVTTPEWMMLPFHEGGTFGPFTTNIGLRVYDFLAGVKKTERRKMFSADQAFQREPLIKHVGLKGAGYYVEYKTDDARLTIEVIKKAVEKGAFALNYTKVIEFIYNKEGKVIGAVIEDQLSKEKYKVYARKIINAAGPWVDELRDKDGSKQGKHLLLTKGVHLVFSKEVFPLQQAIYFDTPDGRMVFAIPRDGKTYVGTTDTPYHGDIAHPTMNVEDRDYIIEAIHYMFPSLTITADDVESSWAGLRPLIAEEGKGPSEISRKDEVFVSDSGLITMAGGKLTGYRKMAEQAVNTVVRQLKKEDGILFSKSETEKLPISGGDVGGSIGFKQYKQEKVSEGITLGLHEADAKKLVQRYGSNVEKVYEIFQDKIEKNDQPITDSLIFAELDYAIRYELAYKPVDFFVRRTGSLFFSIDWVKKYKEPVMEYMKGVLNWDTEEKDTYKRELEQLLREAVTPVK